MVKQALITLLLVSALLITGCQTPPMAGATIASKTFGLPTSTSVTYDTNTYIKLEIKDNGSMIDADDGTIDASWADAAIATAAHATNTDTYTATIPPLDNKYQYVMRIYSGTTYSTSDTLQAGPYLYIPELNAICTDTNPLESGKYQRVIRYLYVE